MDTAKALSYCNRALVDIGAQPIVSFDDGSAAANIADQRYESVIEELLSYSRWSFATLQTQLSRLADPEAPLFDWAYVYLLPTTPRFIRLVRIARTSDSLHSMSSIVFPRAQRQAFAIRAYEYADTQHTAIFCDYDELFVEYIGRVEERIFPPAFEECVVQRMAIAFSMALTENTDLITYFHERLYGKPGRAGVLGRAVHYDRSNAPRSGIVDDAGLLSGR